MAASGFCTFSGWNVQSGFSISVFSKLFPSAVRELVQKAQLVAIACILGIVSELYQ